uniref:PIK-related kinase FAT domain-containing protein n=1 Tax=Meloidogyne javanica TaxID=6303 RepID=A0A915LHE0_MELJA
MNLINTILYGESVHGDFVRARETAEKLMLYLNEKLFKSDSLNAVTPAILSEFQVFEHCWIDSCKQLNDWTSLEAFSNSDEVANINLLTETAWHLSDWKLLKDCLIQLDAAGDPSMTIKSSLYKLMINIANFDQLDFRPILNKEFNGKAFVEINKMLITNWKKLPSIISHSHLEILNLAHFTHEVCESANVINNNLQSINFPSHQQQQQNGSSSSSSNNLNTSVKHLLKSWRSRPITNIDQLNSLVDLFTWRSQFFCSILNFYENTDQKSLLTLPVHTLAQTQIQLSRMLRRSNQLELAQNELNKREEAGRAFSAAAQLDHDLLGGTSVWKHWGDFLTSIFMSNINENSAQITGIQAIACTLEHAKISPSPLKARLSIAKFLWLIKILTSFGGSEKILTLLNELLEKYVDNETINPSNWLNALLMEAQQRPSPAILNILKCIGKAFPQKMFYDLRIVLGSKNVTEYLQKYRLSLQNTNNNGNNNHNASQSTSSSSINITTTSMENIENQDQLASILFCICENNFIEIDALNKIMLDFENFPISPLE